MIAKTALETSKVVFLIRTLRGFYANFERWTEAVYSGSYLSRLINYFVGIVCLSYNESFLKVLMGSFGAGNAAILNNSKLVQRLENSYKKLTKRFDNLHSSLFGNWAMSAKKELTLHSIKALSIILIFSSVINLILSFIFQRDLGTVGLTAQFIFLIIGLLGLSCDVEWPTIKRGSIILKVLFR